MTPRHLNRLLTATAALGLLSLGAPPAHAHAIQSSLERLEALNNSLVLESSFSTGEPADDAVIRLLPPDGEPIEIGRTDAGGRIEFSLPPQARAQAGWEVQVDGGPGHRDYLELPGSAELPARPLEAISRAPWSLPTHSALLSGLALIGGGSAGMLALRRRS